MEKTQLAAMCFLLSTFVASQAFQCMSSSNCCEETTLNKVVKKLTDHSSQSTQSARSSRSVSSSDDCRSIPGVKNMASSSPWRYVEDIQDSRYPRLLWKAQCICQNSCVSLRHPVENATEKTFVQKEVNGESVPIFADTTVYYRRPCANVDKSFYLEPQKYPLPVACTCVATQ
ncbi:interleukin-25-like [Podarcis raffonei]|uniref:interleukin-25-like n=1 Tax=Podarcis raffonei TaxID=65483 RepID=UPI0023296871|nr:interleukin-25-like [Podarcis raffonei]